MAGQLILFKLGISCVGLAFAAARTNWIRNDKREHREADWLYWASDVVHCRVYSGVGDGEHKVGERKQIIYYYFQLREISVYWNDFFALHMFIQKKCIY